MEVTISQRLIEFMRYSGENQVSLSKKIGVPQSSIATIISRNTGLNSGTIEKLHIAFPILSLEWLITGNGPMLKSASSTETTTDNGNDYYSSDTDHKVIIENRILKKENELLKEQLQRAIDDKDKVMAMLDKALSK